MGIIQKQSTVSSIIILIGFAIGGVNMLLIAPKILTAQQLGLTRVITDAGLTMATVCTFGALPIIYKFFPIYRSYTQPKKNELPFLTLIVCLIGFLLVSSLGYACKDLIVRKFSEKSPLFVQYSYLVYPFAFFMLMFIWLESYSWTFKKGVISNSLKETIPRILFTILLLLLFTKTTSFNVFIILFSLSFALPSVLLFFILRHTKEFYFYPHIGITTRRLKGKMANFGLFLFGAQFLNLLSKTVDTFILTAKAERGLVDTAVFTIATYIVALLEIPQRSLNAIAIPVIAEAWRKKDKGSIQNIYTKSVNNLLIIGILIFGIILLNAHNLAGFLGKDYNGIEWVVFLLGIAKLVDLGTGANTQIISTSSYWKVDFTTNVIYTIMALPMNYILISRYGLMGAAYSNLITITFYNLMRFGFLWYKFNLQPYNLKDTVSIVAGLFAAAIAYLLPQMPLIADVTARTFVFLILFIPIIYFSKISMEINYSINKSITTVLRLAGIKKFDKKI
ncbi:hypothetical protein [Parafilimonas sp.]|uniref:hypothetical protein n=1 Tax=Parafilimonas sp. TaxID=1969739 RepID=UPI0039E29880